MKTIIERTTGLESLAAIIDGLNGLKDLCASLDTNAAEVWCAPVDIALEQDTLSDGSKVFNLYLKQGA